MDGMDERLDRIANELTNAARASRIQALIEELERLTAEHGTPVRIMAAGDTTPEGIAELVRTEREAAAEWIRKIGGPSGDVLASAYLRDRERGGRK
jgi:precorrin-6B methylase 1